MVVGARQAANFQLHITRISNVYRKCSQKRQNIRCAAAVWGKVPCWCQGSEVRFGKLLGDHRNCWWRSESLQSSISEPTVIARWYLMKWPVSVCTNVPFSSSALLLFCWWRNWELMCTSIFSGKISNCPENRPDLTCWSSVEICSECKVDNTIPGWCTGPWWCSCWIYSPEESLRHFLRGLRSFSPATGDTLGPSAVMSANAAWIAPRVRRHHVFQNLISKARLLKWSNEL